MRLVLMGGSLRPASLNARLLDYLAQTLGARGHKASPFSGEALRLPLYEDGEAPTAAIQALHAGLLKAHGLVIVSPEYNAGIPGHLKNAVDWLSTMKPSPWAGLPVLLCAASPGAFGGARGLMAWRATLANMGALAPSRRRTSNWTRRARPPMPAPPRPCPGPWTPSWPWWPGCGRSGPFLPS